MSTTKKPAAATAAKTPAKTTAKAPAKPVARAAAKPVARVAAKKPAAVAVAAKPVAEKPAAPKAYKMLTGIDGQGFCEKVSAHIADGYELYGSPTMILDGKNWVLGQAVVYKGKKKKAKRK
jgi:hypothetical protein